MHKTERQYLISVWCHITFHLVTCELPLLVLTLCNRLHYITQANKYLLCMHPDNNESQKYILDGILPSFLMLKNTNLSILLKHSCSLFSNGWMLVCILYFKRKAVLGSNRAGLNTSAMIEKKVKHLNTSTQDTSHENPRNADL